MQQGISQKKTARLKGAQDFFLRNSVAFLDVSAPNIFLCEEKEEKIGRNQAEYLLIIPVHIGGVLCLCQFFYCPYRMRKMCVWGC